MSQKYLCVVSDNQPSECRPDAKDASLKLYEWEIRLLNPNTMDSATWKALAALHNESLLELYDSTAGANLRTSDDMKDSYDAADDRILLVKAVYGTIVAYAVIETGLKKYTLWDVCVDRRYRGLGVGLKMVRFLTDARYTPLVTTVFQRNKAAQKFFKSCGFETLRRNTDHNLIEYRFNN